MSGTGLQPSLFDVPAPDDWAAWFVQAEACALRIVERGGTFTAETLRDRGVWEPPRSSMRGQLTHRLERRGLIVWTGDAVRSARKSRRGGLDLVWKAAA